MKRKFAQPSKSLKAKLRLQNFILLLMSLSLDLIGKNSYILAGICFILLKKHPRLNLKGFQYQILTFVKGLGSSYQVGQILALFCKLVALIFD